MPGGKFAGRRTRSILEQSTVESRHLHPASVGHAAAAAATGTASVDAAATKTRRTRSSISTRSRFHGEVRGFRVLILTGFSAFGVTVLVNNVNRRLNKVILI